MKADFQKVKSFLQDLNLDIASEHEEDGLFIIHQENKGFVNLLIEVEDPIIVIEQLICPLINPTADMLSQLLKKNREIVHGAFTLDEGNRLLFRDTLQLENLDLNELESSLNSLSLLLSEYSDKILEFSKH